MYLKGTKNEYEGLFVNDEDKEFVTLGKYLYGGCDIYFAEALHRVIGLRKCTIHSRHAGSGEGPGGEFATLCECCLDSSFNFVDARGVIPRDDDSTFLEPYGDWDFSEDDVAIVLDCSYWETFSEHLNDASKELLSIAEKWIKRHPELYGKPQRASANN